MIRLVMDGMCEGCKYADLEVSCAESFTGEKAWVVKCIHRSACDHMETKTINRMAQKGEQNERYIRML